MTARIALAASVMGILVAGGTRAVARSQADAAAPAAKITGTVTYRERVALPPDAVVHVRLDDMSQPEASPRRVAEATVATAGRQVPIAFELSYRPTDIVPSRRYVVRARIMAGDKTLFSTKAPYPVITRGAPTSLEILLQQGGSGRPGRPRTPPAGGAGIAGIEWTLVKLGATLGATPAVERPEAQRAHLALDLAKKTLSGSTGCNRFTGRFDLADGLHLNPGGMTMMACTEDVMRQEQAFLEALRQTTGYRLESGSLKLVDAEGRVMAGFAASDTDPAARSH